MSTVAVAEFGVSGGPVSWVTVSVAVPVSRAVTSSVMFDPPKAVSTAPVVLQAKRIWPFGGMAPPAESKSWAVTGREQNPLVGTPIGQNALKATVSGANRTPTGTQLVSMTTESSIWLTGP